MTDILLIIFSIILIYFIYRFVKIYQTARAHARNERDRQNVDLTSKLDAELDTGSEIGSEPEKTD